MTGACVCQRRAGGGAAAVQCQGRGPYGGHMAPGPGSHGAANTASRDTQSSASISDIQTVQHAAAAMQCIVGETFV